MRIECGPTGERRVRSALMGLLVGGFCVAFFYDGYVRYPAQNLEQYLNQLPAPDRPKARPELNPRVTLGSAEELRRKLDTRDVAGRQKIIEDLYGALPNHEGPETWHYFGPGCTVRVEVSGGVPRPNVVAVKANKSETDLRWQKALGAVLLVIAVPLGLHVLRVFRTRVVLDDAGLRFNRRRPIPWDKMARLDAEEYRAKGWIDLYYDAGGQERMLRLNDYHFVSYREVIDEICRRTGWPNPLVRPSEAPTPSG